MNRLCFAEEPLEAQQLDGFHCSREKIEDFIDENKSMIRRMFGNMLDPSVFHYETFDGQKIHHRGKRSTKNSQSSNKVDACESTVEIVTPYWASNSQGKIRAIVNTQHLQQAIQQVGNRVCFPGPQGHAVSDCFEVISLFPPRSLQSKLS